MKLGDMIFKTKTEAKKFVSNFLKVGIIKNEDKEWIIDLFSFHEDAERKLQGLTDIIIKKSSFGQNCFHIIKGDKLEDISYRKCFNKESEKQKINRALRHEINHQISDFRNSINIFECDICKKNLKGILFHIDHKIKFKDLANEFLEKEGKIETISINYCRKIVDQEVKQRWTDFHFKNAVLRPLCVRCNVSEK